MEIHDYVTDILSFIFDQYVDEKPTSKRPPYPSKPILPLKFGSQEQDQSQNMTNDNVLKSIWIISGLILSLIIIIIYITCRAYNKQKTTIEELKKTLQTSIATQSKNVVNQHVYTHTPPSQPNNQEPPNNTCITKPTEPIPHPQLDTSLSTCISRPSTPTINNSLMNKSDVLSQTPTTCNTVTTPRITVFSGYHVQPPPAFNPKKMEVKTWIRSFETFIDVNNICANRKDIMMSYIDIEFRKIFENNRFSENDEEAYRELKALITKLYDKRDEPSIQLKRKFMNRRQEPNENLHLYVATLKQLAVKAHPDVADYILERYVIDQFIEGLNNNEIKIKLLVEKPFTNRLDQIVELAERYHDAIANVGTNNDDNNHKQNKTYVQNNNYNQHTPNRQNNHHQNHQQQNNQQQHHQQQQQNHQSPPPPQQQQQQQPQQQYHQN